MRQKPGGREMRFTAVQRFDVGRVAFSWQARFPLVGPLALRIVDEYGDGEGKLEGRLLGVPVLRETGPDAAAAQATRYLAELAWVPQAMAHNPDVPRRCHDVCVLRTKTAGSPRRRAWHSPMTQRHTARTLPTCTHGTTPPGCG